MRVLMMFVVATLGVAVIAEGAYIVRTRSQMAALESRVTALVNDHETGGYGAAPRYAGAGDDPADPEDRPARGERPALPPPKLIVPSTGHAGGTPSNDPLPLPALLDSAESREQLRQFILAQLERERQEAQQRADQRREDRDRQRSEQLAKALGLSGSDSEKFMQILANAQQARMDLRSRIQSGDVRGDQIRTEMQALRAKSDDELRGLLGDDRMQKLGELRRQGGGPGGDGFPRGLGWFGPRAQAAGPGGPGPAGPPN